MELKWLVEFLHGLPRVTLDLSNTTATFDPWSLEYVESVGLWGAVVLAVGALLLVVVLLSWCVRCCCSKPKEPAKRQAKIRSLSTGLFLVSLACFAFLGLALFSNERVNRGLSAAGDSLGDLAHDVAQAVRKVRTLNATLAHNVSQTQLSALATQLRGPVKALNDTEQGRVGEVMKNVSDALDAAQAESGELAGVLGRLDSFRPAASRLLRVENERWITFAVLLSITLLVVFGGVVGFCRHSKKAAVVESGLGLVVFAVVWLLAALVAAASIALADFCADPQPFLLAQFPGNRSRNITHFFLTCTVPKEGAPELLPPTFVESEAEINAEMDAVKTGLGGLSALSKELFSPSVATAVGWAAGNMSTTLTECGTELTKTEQLLSCSGSVRRDYGQARAGACETALSGAGLGLVGLVLLGLFLALLLLCLGRAWDLFTKRPMDYVEVEDEDPFLPRGLNPNHDSTIPADFYGSHVYNPRTRFASSQDSEGPGGLGGGLGGGPLGTTTVGSGPTGDGATPLWSRTAPPPPAYDVVHNGRYNHH